MPIVLLVTDENGPYTTVHADRAQALACLRANYAAGDDVPGWDDENDELIGFVQTQGVSVELLEIDTDH